jgi:hypothetical protein
VTVVRCPSDAKALIATASGVASRHAFADEPVDFVGVGADDAGELGISCGFHRDYPGRGEGELALVVAGMELLGVRVEDLDWARQQVG